MASGSLMIDVFHPPKDGYLIYDGFGANVFLSFEKATPQVIATPAENETL